MLINKVKGDQQACKLKIMSDWIMRLWFQVPRKAPGLPGPSGGPADDDGNAGRRRRRSRSRRR